MADRVKYFLLGLLFFIVASVIAYDVWVGKGADVPTAEEQANGGSLHVVPKPRPKPKPEVDPAPPRPEPDPQPLPRPEPKPKPIIHPKPKPKPAVVRYHVVKSGETLGVIAKTYYGTQRGVQWIVDANKLDNPNRIKVKQTLVIPPRPKGEKAPPPQTKPKRVPLTYAVKEGEDLDAICRRFFGDQGHGATVNRIMGLNDLWSADVATGTVLRLREE